MSPRTADAPRRCPRCGQPSLVFLPACDLLTALVLTMSAGAPTEPSFDLSESWQCRNPMCVRLSGIGRPRPARAVAGEAGRHAAAV